MNTFVPSAAERRRISREARDAFPRMGVYAIRSEASGRVRVASSRNVPGAINRIEFELRLGSHPDKALQADWKLNPAAISFEVLELVKERTDPDFDYSAELSALEELYRAELCTRSEA
ncbi:GIY-YIG nuclease family protein [Burkholderiaceae bacterium FT117]|uniref:GIY-YIG nuclease family protein n=1 Tax=Zeimonas sediminis TaxID=2944268 RepID=UPI0023431D1C|nr:GIY-YIG nuclease family protein [Zeimonas sediminis]MCM5569290.1 GIY-YIG nuclease family protein [Zeimonas sediminis]